VYDFIVDEVVMCDICRITIDGVLADEAVHLDLAACRAPFGDVSLSTGVSTVTIFGVFAPKITKR
jgi:hypothetical protein